MPCTLIALSSFLQSIRDKHNDYNEQARLSRYTPQLKTCVSTLYNTGQQYRLSRSLSLDSTWQYLSHLIAQSSHQQIFTMPSVRRLINHTRNRSEDAFDSADVNSSSPPSVSSTPPKHRRFSPQQRSPFALPSLGKVTSADSHTSTRKGSKPPQISAPRSAAPQAPVSKTSTSAPKLPVPQLGERASMLALGMGHSTSNVSSHRRNVSEGTKTTQPATTKPPSRKGTPVGSKGQQMMKPPPLMHQRPLKAIHRPGSAPQRSSSLRQEPTKPAKETAATLQPSPLKRPSLVSHSSDSFISIRASGVRASIASDPGTDAVDRRSKDDLDVKEDTEVDYSDDVRNFMLEAEKAFQLGGDPRLSLAARRKSNHPKVQVPQTEASQPSKPSQPLQASDTTTRPAATPVPDTSRTATPTVHSSQVSGLWITDQARQVPFYTSFSAVGYCANSS